MEELIEYFDTDDQNPIYEGQMLNSNKHGLGKVTWPDGTYYEGNFYDDKRHGKGRYQWNDGRVYQGEYVNGAREGKGTYTWPDGSVYVGEFLQGFRHGKGRYVWPNGSVYVGEYRKGKQSGFGRFESSTGYVYEGGFVKGKEQGDAVVIWEDGRKYVGEYFNGKKWGFGFMTWPDGSYYKGYYKNGKRHGKGVFQSSDGWCYSGMFDSNHMDGFGVYNDQGINYIREYKKSTLISSMLFPMFWRNDDVVRWCDFDWDGVAAVFRNNSIDGEILSKLSREDLVRMNTPSRFIDEIIERRDKEYLGYRLMKDFFAPENIAAQNIDNTLLDFYSDIDLYDSPPLKQATYTRLKIYEKGNVVHEKKYQRFSLLLEQLGNPALVIKKVYKVYDEMRLHRFMRYATYLKISRLLQPVFKTTKMAKLETLNDMQECMNKIDSINKDLLIHSNCMILLHATDNAWNYLDEDLVKKLKCKGFYGRGMYFTPSFEHACKLRKNARHVLVCLVQWDAIEPMIDTNRNGSDTRVVTVSSTFFPRKRGISAFMEVIVDRDEQVLPLYVFSLFAPVN
eukprot:TRINITY_DN3968_c0_g1_i1.p1 TRINITY_DN3968_c0_g1~~TRINITY_DN3968_c0_g1_i1.p1  ORF type:complete len:571 (-),score=103.06 TRINITY_DN3968_c0_g1_i1:489-2177(-)